MKNKVTTNVTFVVKTFAYTAINRVQKVHILNLENNPQKRGRPLVIQCKQAPNWYSIQYFDYKLHIQMHFKSDEGFVNNR